jgi:dimethylglycine dehydrogenase
MSLALAYVDTEVIEGASALAVYVLGEERAARNLPEPPYDPKGERLREMRV